MNREKRVILAIVLSSYLITAINGAIIITGLTNMAKELSLSMSALSWVQNAYVLSWGGFMLLGGRMSDTCGRKRMLNLSLVLFGVSSLTAGIAHTAEALIASRFVQGAGAAVLAPTSLALIMDHFKGREQVQAIAWYSSISGLGLSVGLIIGGALASFFSWRFGFFIYLPVVALMLVMSQRVLKSNAKQDEKSQFDIPGTLLSVTGIFAFVYSINGADNAGAWLCAAIILIAAFIFVEKRTSAPLMPLMLFNGTRSRANAARILFAGSMMGFYFFISEYMQEVFRFTPLQVGIAFFPLTVSTFVSAVKVPSAIMRWGDKRVLFAGLTLMLLGFSGMLSLSSSSSYVTGIALPMLVLGIGQGFTMSPLTNLGIKDVHAEHSGAASGVVNAATRQDAPWDFRQWLQPRKGRTAWQLYATSP